MTEQLTMLSPLISPNELGVVFRGIHSRNFGLKLQTVADQPFGTMTEQIQDVPAIIGDVYEGVNMQSKVINIGFRTVGIKSNQEKEERIHMIADWLKPIDDNEDELRIDIIPRWMFYAHVSSSFDITSVGVYDFAFVIPFSCSDPHMYGEQKQYAINGFNLAIGAGEPVSSTAGNFKLYDLFNSVTTIKPNFLSFDYTAQNAGTFKVVAILESLDGEMSSNDVTGILNAADGHFEGAVNLGIKPDTTAVKLQITQITSSGKLTISNLRIYESDQLATEKSVNTHTGKVDETLVTVNDDTSVTLHDELSNETSYPVFTLICPSELTKIAITAADDDDYFYMGTEIDEEAPHEIVDNKPRRLWDRCNTMANWRAFSSSYPAPFEIENGMINTSAQLESTSNSVRPKLKDGHYSFGNTLTKGYWNGPGAMHISLPGSYEDFQLVVRFEIQNRDPRAMGKIEVYGLDENQNPMVKTMLKDRDNSKKVYAQAQVGNHAKHHDIYYSTGKTVRKGKTRYKKIKYYRNNKKKTIKYKSKGKTKTKVDYVTKSLASSTATGTFTNFYGEISITKIGHKYKAEITKLGDKPWKTPITTNWTDKKGDYDGHKLSGLAVFFGKWPITEDLVNPKVEYKEDRMLLEDIKVFEIINGGKNEVTNPTPIVKMGDEIKFDTSSGIVYKNGKPFNSIDGHLLKAPGSNLQGLGIDNAADKTYSFYPSIKDASWLIDHRPVRI